MQFADLEFYPQLNNIDGVRCVIRNLTGLPTYAAEYTNFYALFQQKNWNWLNDFGPNARAFIDDLTIEQRGSLLQAFSNWPESYSHRFSAVFNDLDLGLYWEGLSQDNLPGILNHLYGDDLEAAISEVVKYTANNPMITLKGDFYNFEAYVYAVGGGEDAAETYRTIFGLRRNILERLTAGFPNAILGNGGLNQSNSVGFIDGLRSSVLPMTIRSAMDVNTSLESQRIFARLRTELEGIAHDFRSGGIDPLIYTEHIDIIRRDFLNYVPLGSVGSGGLTEAIVRSIYDEITIGGALSEAIETGLRNCVDPEKSLALANLKGRVETLYIDFLFSEQIAYENFSLLRNRIREELVALLPTPQLMGTGLDEVEIAVVLRNITRGRLDLAIDHALAVTNDVTINKEFLKIKGRINDLMYDRQVSRLLEEEVPIFNNRIIEALIYYLR